MNYQLRSLIEWAKDLKGFIELSDNDKVERHTIAVLNATGVRLDCAAAWPYGREPRSGRCLPFVNL